MLVIVAKTEYYGPKTEISLYIPFEDGQALLVPMYETEEAAQEALDALEASRNYSDERLAHNQSAAAKFALAAVVADRVDEPSEWQFIDRYLSFTSDYPEDWSGWNDSEAAYKALAEILEGEGKAIVSDGGTSLLIELV